MDAGVRDIVRKVLVGAATMAVAGIGAAIWGEAGAYLELKRKVAELSPVRIEPATTLHTIDLEDRDGNGRIEVRMIGYGEGMCYLTRVEGPLGRGEYVRVWRQGDHWTLQGRAKNDRVEASARCWRWPTLDD